MLDASLASGSVARARAPLQPPGALRIKAAGDNEHGQCGVPKGVGACFLSPIAADGLHPPEELRIGDGADPLVVAPASRCSRPKEPDDMRIAQISCGCQFIVMRTAQGTVLHAGSNYSGQRGDGSDDSDAYPQLHIVELPFRAVDISAGGWHVASVLKDGSAYTWGHSVFGACGRLSGTTKILSPGAVDGVSHAERVFAGSKMTFIVCRGDDVVACGRNDCGQLCLGRVTRAERTPQRVTALCGAPHIVQLQLGAEHGIVLRADGYVSVWGQLTWRLADGSADWDVARGTVPIRLGYGRAQCVAAGWSHCGVVGEDGNLRLWGENLMSFPCKAPLPSGRPARSVVCGNGTTFVRSLDGHWASCGNGKYGLPFGHDRKDARLHPCSGSRTGLAADCEVVCGSMSTFALFLEGPEAQEVHYTSCGSRELTEKQYGVLIDRWKRMRSKRAALRAGCAGALCTVVTTEVHRVALASAMYAAAMIIVACDEDLQEVAERYQDALPVRHCLRGLRGAAILLLQPAASGGGILRFRSMVKEAKKNVLPSTAAGRTAKRGAGNNWLSPISPTASSAGAPSPISPMASSGHFLTASGGFGAGAGGGGAGAGGGGGGESGSWSDGGGSPALGGSDIDWELGDGGGVQNRQEDGALDAQQHDTGVSLSEFAERAEADANVNYPRSDCTDIRAECLVEAVPADELSLLCDRSPIGMQLGVTAEVVQDPAKGNVKVSLAETTLAGRQTRGHAVEISIRPALETFPADALRRVEAPMILRWIRDLPGKWEREADSADFRPEDVACTRAMGHRSRRPAGKAHFCCMQQSLPAVICRMLSELEKDAEKPAWEDGLVGFVKARGASQLQEGIAAAHLFSLEMINPRTNRPRKIQMYQVLNAAMRKNWAERMKSDTDAAQRLRVFAPLVYHLHSLTRGMAHSVDHVIVYRGIGTIVAQGYQAGSTFVWGCFSSTAGHPKVAASFAAGVGTLFVVRERTAAPIAMCSLYPSEAERVVPPASLKVLARMPETTLCVAETRSDIVIAEEQPAPGEAPRFDPQREAEIGVRLRLEAHRSSAFIFKMFAGRFVEPRLLVDGAEEETRLFAHFEGAGAEQRVTLLRGDGGTGKTSISLALLERMLQQASAAQVKLRKQHAGRWKKAAHILVRTTPMFLHCPWAEGLLSTVHCPLTKLSNEYPGTQVGPIVKALCAALAITTPTELAELQRQPMIVLLDSLDECPISEKHPPGELLEAHSLLKRGGVLADDWPKARFVVCCRKEYLEMHNITPQMLDDGPVSVCDIRPFAAEEQIEYVRKLTSQEVMLLTERLGKGSDLVAQLGRMRCVPCDPDAAHRIREGLGALRGAMRKVAQTAPADRTARREAEAAEQAAKDALEREKETAEQQCRDGVHKVLECLGPDLLKNPFALFLSCSASRDLVGADLSIAPRYRVYGAWLRLDQADRLSRVPELDEVMPETPERSDRLLDAVSTLAVGMYQQCLWQADVGRCVRILGGGPMARAVLSVLPLRMESAQRDCCRVTWRHRTVQEFAIARALLLPGRTMAADWEAALCGPLHTSPEAQAFFKEGWETLVEDERAQLATLLSMAASAKNTAVLTDMAQLQQQQQEMAEEQSAVLRDEVAALRQKLKEQQKQLWDKDSIIKVQGAELEKHYSYRPRQQSSGSAPRGGRRSDPITGVPHPKRPSSGLISAPARRAPAGRLARR